MCSSVVVLKHLHLVPKKAEFEDAPPVVTGKQTGVENPKDTKKITDQLLKKEELMLNQLKKFRKVLRLKKATLIYQTSG